MLSKEDMANLLIKDVTKFNNALDGKAFDMSEMDFSGINVEGAIFDNVDLTSSSFADSNLTDVKFLGCDLTSVDFNRANLAECAFNESVLNGTDFSYSKVDYCNFIDADLAGAIMLEADFTNSDFSACENLNASRFDDTTIWPDNEYLPEDFDSSYSDDLSSLKDDEEYEVSDY
ncbi:pentapeptide repeat-containing protein [bacterium]|nr:pentapeptide repeat-containing protein [bacterium]